MTKPRFGGVSFANQVPVVAYCVEKLHSIENQAFPLT
jgi:hypothetical protein